jgi:hypothetical protein
MSEALEWAAEFAERTVLKIPTKANGYAIDGYKAPTPSERSEIIKDLAITAYTAEKEENHEADTNENGDGFTAARARVMWENLVNFRKSNATDHAAAELLDFISSAEKTWKLPL